jgi:hypothetical protein
MQNNDWYARRVTDCCVMELDLGQYLASVEFEVTSDPLALLWSRKVRCHNGGREQNHENAIGKSGSHSFLQCESKSAREDRIDAPVCLERSRHEKSFLE